MKAKYLLFLLCLNGIYAFSQKESANWYFGNFAGINFNSTNAVPLIDGKIFSNEGCSTISDGNGNLLFYTDGVTVWDRRHEVMPNGTGLFGHKSSTESSIIIPKPGSNSSFFIFTVDQPSYYLKSSSFIKGVCYSEIDLVLNGGFGDVVNAVKNIPLVTYNENNDFESEYKSSEKITAVSHSDGDSVWVITTFMDRFYSFLVDVNGVNPIPVISRVNQTVAPIINESGANISAIGYLKASPNGKKLAVAHSSILTGNPRKGHKKSGKVLLYNFNSTNGVVSDQIEILSGAYPYGVEFSPNSKLLYVTNNTFDKKDDFISGELFQYDLLSPNISASRLTLSSSGNSAGALQLALNGKIYRAGYKATSSGLNISVINDPNIKGVHCNYSENSFYLGGSASELGLPLFVQSIFLNKFDYEYDCLGDQTRFYITSEDPYDSVLWDFGDGQYSTDEEPLHTFSTSGVYKVSLTMSLNGVEGVPLVKQVIISEPPKVINGIYDLIQCDSNDDDPNDGITTFNLQLANSSIILNKNEAVQIFYYHTLTDAVNDVLNNEAIDNIYRNKNENELLYAKVVKANTDCYSLAKIQLKTVLPLDIGVKEVVVCFKADENFTDFDLSDETEKIKTDWNLSTNALISFYSNASEAAVGLNPLPNSIQVSGNERLYIRVENDYSCYGFGILQLKKNEFPLLSDKVINVCQAEFPIQINSGINSNQDQDLQYIWSTDETTNDIVVDEPGIYEVTIYNVKYGCQQTINVTVIQNETPDLQKIEIDGNRIEIMLNNADDKVFMYALDDINGPYQNDNKFYNIGEGLHRIFVRDIHNCENISKEFYIVGFPKFFTPNGDGINDYWNVYGLEPGEFSSNVCYIEIYDRYGKLLKSFNPLSTEGWDGRFNGHYLIPEDYWYVMKLPNGDIFRGHFTLKK